MSSEDVDQLRQQASLAVNHARDINAVKAQRLVMAITCEVLAIAVLVAAIILIVILGRH
jgi:hypothetical protein